MRLIDADELEKCLCKRFNVESCDFEEAPCWVHKSVIDNMPTIDAVPRAAYDRAVLERDFAINQLGEDYGVGLGEKKPIDAVEVVNNYSVGDFCIYGFAEENKSLAIVEIIKILDDPRGVAELKFHKVIIDDTGNGFFEYLLRSGNTMNGSFKYLKNITPKAE